MIWVDPEGGRGSPPALKNDKNEGFLRNTGPDPLKNKNSFKRALIVLYWAIIGPPAGR